MHRAKSHRIQQAEKVFVQNKKKKIDGGVHEFILNKKYMLSYHMHDYDE